jgi:glycosyltransferase involved in cell wall biosynthesis
MRVAIFFDNFNEKGGAERVAIMLAKYLKADIYTTYVDWKKADPDLKKLKVHEMGLIFKNLKILTYSEIAYRFSKIQIPNYDAYLFLRTYCFSAAKNHHPNIWISTGILRALYDLYDFFYNKLNIWQKPIFQAWSSFYRNYDQKWTKNFDSILSNCETTKKKIKKYYDRDSKIAHHPVDTSRFYCKSFEDFYLAPSRLVKEKRVDLILEAFKEMPDKKLKVAGYGPEIKNLKKMVKGCPNIEFLGGLDFKSLIDLYARCTATISLNSVEGWGMIPVESMAAGKPCIAGIAGKESIINGKTGFSINLEKEEIKKYVRILTPEKAEKMKKDCIRRAKEFDVKIFIKKTKAEIKNLM